jgi:hypothetical protein
MGCPPDLRRLESALFNCTWDSTVTWQPLGGWLADRYRGIVPSDTVVDVDLRGTRNRLGRLRKYVEANLLNQGDFVCAAQEGCRSSCRPGDSFREGTMSHVGRRFDLRLDGKPLRIVVVGQESGWPKDPQLQPLARRVSLDDRYRHIHGTTGLQRRYYAEADHPARSTHMRGTTSALRLIFGKGLGSDHAGEFIRPRSGKVFHLFDGFAMVNRLLCSAGPPQTSQGRPTSTMFRNCRSHFAATMAILEPTLLISQGRLVGKWVNQLLPPDHAHGTYLHEAHREYGRVLVCTFSHPSAHGSLRWGDRLDAPYLTDVVAPTLDKAVSLV